MYTLRSLFMFSFGGFNNFGELESPKKKLEINFPEENPVGYGIAIRNGLDIEKFTSPKKLEVEISSTTDLVLTLEIKAAPGNQVIKSNDYTLTKGINNVEHSDFDVYGHEISEIVLFTSQAKNPGKIGSLKIQNFELS